MKVTPAAGCEWKPGPVSTMTKWRGEQCKQCRRAAQTLTLKLTLRGDSLLARVGPARRVSPAHPQTQEVQVASGRATSLTLAVASCFPVSPSPHLSWHVSVHLTPGCQAEEALCHSASRQVTDSRMALALFSPFLLVFFPLQTSLLVKAGDIVAPCTASSIDLDFPTTHSFWSVLAFSALQKNSKTLSFIYVYVCLELGFRVLSVLEIYAC